jgi:tetratricopeptide (TPR) repeat protein
MDSYNFDALRSKGHALKNMGEYEKAVDYYNEILKTFPYSATIKE